MQSKIKQIYTIFDQKDKILIVLSATTAGFTLIFSLTTGIVKIVLTLNSIDTLISQALINMDISHEEFITILKEKDRYEMMKDNLRNKNGESYEIMRFNSVKSKT